MSKVLVIVSTAETEKAVLGILWAAAAVKEKWVDDLELVFFGPIEEKIALGNKTIMNAIEEYRKLGKKPVACERVARSHGYLESLSSRIEVGPVGKMIGEYIEKGYVPLVF